MKYNTLINVSYVKSGSGSATPRVSLPISALQAMGVNEKDRTIVLNYDSEGCQIKLKKYHPLETFDFNFEYKFMEKIDQCYSKIISENYDLTGITGNINTFSIRFGGQEINGEPCERDNRLLFSNKTVVQVLLQKEQIIMFVDNMCFNKRKEYYTYIDKLKSELKILANDNGISFNESSELINH